MVAVALFACSTMASQTSTRLVAQPAAYAQFVNRQRSNLAVWDLVIGPAVESQRRRSHLEIAKAGSTAVERAAMQKAASATAEQPAAEQAAEELASTEQAVAGQAAAEQGAASTLFNVAMPPLPLQQGGARLLLREDMAIEEQDASLSASRRPAAAVAAASPR